MREQLRIAAGLPLSVTQEEVRLSGHAIECRINAEDPGTASGPARDGRTSSICPAAPGCGWTPPCISGYQLPPYYDSLMAKVIVHAPTRLEAIRRMRRALEELIIEGYAHHRRPVPPDPLPPRLCQGAVRHRLPGAHLETLLAWDCGTEG